MESLESLRQSPSQEISDGVVSEIHSPRDDVYSPNNSVRSREEESEASFDIVTLGRELELDGSGKCVQFSKGGKESSTIVYYKTPSSPELVRLFPGAIIAYSTRLLKSLCQSYESYHQTIAKWNCQIKYSGCLRATCNCSGAPAVSKSTGQRNRISKKIGCPASVTTASPSNADELAAIEEAHKLLEGEIHDESGRKMELVMLRKVHFVHTCFKKELTRRNSIHLHGRNDVLNNEAIYNSLRTFMKSSKKGKGSFVRAKAFIEAMFPNVTVSESAVKNALAVMRENNDEASNLITFLSDQIEDQAVEYLRFRTNPSNGVLEFVVWTISGSKDLVDRCGDVAFWDTTYNTTRFLYKLGSISLVDSESKTRGVLFTLSLRETSEVCLEVISHWETAFKRRLPRIIFTDGDSAMNCALSSLSYSGELFHLLCTWHLFDKNVKSRVQPVFIGKGLWSEFRRSLSICSKALLESEFQALWDGIMETHLPEDGSTRNARKYLNQHLYAHRTKWCQAYFPNELTLGAASTQRCESWHSTLKSSANCRSLTDLASAVNVLGSRQANTERLSADPYVRLSGLSSGGFDQSKALISLIGSMGISRYACCQISNELSAANRCGVTNAKRFSRKFRGVDCNAITGFCRYSWGVLPGEPNHSRKCTVMLIDDVHNLRPPRCLRDEPVVFCECNYYMRMHLPCRHIFAVCIELSKPDDPLLKSWLEKEQYACTISYVLRNSISPRWKLPHFQTIDDTDDDPKLGNADKFSNESYLRPALDIKDSSECADVISFPKSISDGGGIQAYNRLLRKFKLVAGEATECNKKLILGSFLDSFVDNLMDVITPGFFEEFQFEHGISKLEETFVAASNLTARKIGKEWDCTVKPPVPRNGSDDELISKKTLDSIDDTINPEIQAAGIQNPPLKNAYKWKSVKNSFYLKSKKKKFSKTEPPSMRSSSGINRDLLNSAGKPHGNSRTYIPAVPLLKEPDNPDTENAMMRVLRPNKRNLGDEKTVDTDEIMNSSNLAGLETTTRKTASSGKRGKNIPQLVQSKSEGGAKRVLRSHACKKGAHTNIEALGEADEFKLYRNIENAPTRVLRSNTPNSGEEKTGDTDEIIDVSNATGPKITRRKIDSSGKKGENATQLALSSAEDGAKRELRSHASRKGAHKNDEAVREANSSQKAGSTPMIDPNEVWERNWISNSSVIPIRIRPLLSSSAKEKPSPNNLEKGSILEVFWKQELTWYRGTVVRLEKEIDKKKTKIWVEYDDGDKETIENFNEILWRQIYNTKGYPKLSYTCPRPSAKALKALESKGYCRGRYSLNRGDVQSLSDEAYLSDGVIDRFLSLLLLESKNSYSHRYGIMSTQTIKFLFPPFEEGDTRLRNWSRGLPLHLLDYIIWPVHTENHYVLVLASLSQRKIYWIDPFSPQSSDHSRYLTKVFRKRLLHGMRMISEKYDNEYEVDRKWVIDSPAEIASKYNFPKQNDAYNCGIFVCIYSWALLTGVPCPKLSTSSNSSIASRLFSVRKLIGGKIAAAAGL